MDNAIGRAFRRLERFFCGDPPQQPRSINEDGVNAEFQQRQRELDVQAQRAAAEKQLFVKILEAMQAEIMSIESRPMDDKELKRLEELNSEANKVGDHVREMNAELQSHEAARRELKAPDDVVVLRRSAHESFGIDMVNKVNIAVIGQRNTCAVDDGAAAVEVNEATSRIQHPEINHIYFWVVSGTGTLSHAGRTYSIDKYMWVFDYLVVMFTDSLSEVDIGLINQAMSYRIPYAVICNQANIDEEVTREGRHNVVQTLKESGIRTDIAQVFFISDHEGGAAEQVTVEESKLYAHIRKEVGGCRYYEAAPQEADNVDGANAGIGQ